jgi:hypothetical protein
MSREGKAGYHTESPEKISTWHKYRFVLVILFFVTTYSLVSLLDLNHNFEREHLRRIMESAGVWGFFFFVAIFAKWRYKEQREEVPMSRRVLWGFAMMVLGIVLPGPAFAQKQEVTITSREVVERLTRLEEGQKALAQRLEEVNTNLTKRIEEGDANLTKRIEEGDASLNRRIDDLRAEMNQRFNDVMTLLQIIISALVALVLAIAGAGFVMWRKILAVDAAVQIKIGLDQAVRDQVLHLEQEVGFVKGKLKELSEALGKG